MIDKEFVLVSQGIEIMRTKSQEKAINYVKKENDDWFDYKQRCIDNYESYADNYIDLEIEYPSEKEKDKEIERLNNIINTFEEDLENMKMNLRYSGVKWDKDCLIRAEVIKQILEKLKELKENGNNE